MSEPYICGSESEGVAIPACEATDGDCITEIREGDNIRVNNDNPQRPIVSADIGVKRVVQGSNIAVNNADPANPVVSLAGNALDGYLTRYGVEPLLHRPESTVPDAINDLWDNPYENLIINGNAEVIQRSTDYTKAGFHYIADRWNLLYLVQNAGIVGSGTSSWPAHMQVRIEATTAMTSGDGTVCLVQDIEIPRYRWRDWNGKTLTFSFNAWFAALPDTPAQDIKLGVWAGSQLGNFSGTGGDPWLGSMIIEETQILYTELQRIGTVPEEANKMIGKRYSMTFSIPDDWFDSNSYTDLKRQRIRIGVGFGSGNAATVPSCGLPADVPVQNGYFQFANFTLNWGENDRGFVSRGYAKELELCKRYYQYFGGYNYYNVGTGSNDITKFISQRWFDAVMRAAPAVMLYDYYDTANSSIRFVAGGAWATTQAIPQSTVSADARGVTIQAPITGKSAGEICGYLLARWYMDAEWDVSIP